MLRALKLRKIPVAGADRLKLEEEIAIRDFLVIAEAVLLESDDLALATALKSPIFGVPEATLERCPQPAGFAARGTARRAG